MNRGFGIERPHDHMQAEHRPPARQLVLIDCGGPTLARLFLADRSLVAEFDAGTEEVASMMQGLVPAAGADGPEWDRALEGNSLDERRRAAIYTLEV